MEKMNYFDKFINVSQQIIRINSVEAAAQPLAPFGIGVKKALEKTLSIASELGFSVKDNDGYYGFAEIGSGELIGMLGHLDTVPIGGGWQTPPLSGDIINGNLCGRGVLDDKAPILACLIATSELLSEGLIPKTRIRIIFGCDEESGWKCMDKYLECEELPILAFTPDGDFPVINCEKGIAYYTVKFAKPTEIIKINGGDRPNMVMDNVIATLITAPPPFLGDSFDVLINQTEVTALGVSAHGSTPQKGCNAFWKLINFLAASYGGVWKTLKNVVTNTDGSGYNLQLHDDVSGNLTINIGTVYDVNEEIVFTLDVRYPISYTMEQITTALKLALTGFEVKQGFYHNPLYIAPDHPLCTTLLDAYEAVTKTRPSPISIGGGTYARALPTAVAFGPIFPWQTSTIHQKDECASLQDLKLMYEIYKEAIKNLCF